MNLFELFVKIGVDDQASKKISNISQKIGNGLKTAAKIGTAAVGVAVAGITTLTTAAIKNYSEYEQLVGGVDTLFKGASKKLQGYAAEAYKTAGMSANDYMKNATAFSASLISSLGGDTEKAAEYANRAMVSMSDNANKMGTNIDSVVQTYQSLARGNFAMLDNLKLGYGGTKAELERLIADAASYTDVQKEMNVTVDAGSTSFDNIVNAIAVVQGKLGIAGATAAEAATTIEGSINSMKASWQNLLTSFVGSGLSLEDEINNFVDSVSTVYENIAPKIEIALDGVVQLVEGVFPKIISKLPELVGGLLPTVVDGVVTITQSLVTTISENGEILVTAVIDAVLTLVTAVLKMLPTVIETGVKLLISLATGIANAIPKLVPTIIDVVLQIVKTLTDTENLKQLLSAAIAIIDALSISLVDAIPALVDAIIMIIESIVVMLTSPENTGKLLKSGFTLVVAIVTGIINAIPRILKGIVQIIGAVISEFKNTNWKEVGQNIVFGLLDGLKTSWASIKKWFSKSIKELVGGVKNLLGIHSPSRVFAGIGENMALGVGEGWEDAFGDAKDGIFDSLDFGETDVLVERYADGTGTMGTQSVSFDTVNINVNGYNVENDDALAKKVAYELQKIMVRKGAVYA